MAGGAGFGTGLNFRVAVDENEGVLKGLDGWRSLCGDFDFSGGPSFVVFEGADVLKFSLGDAATHRTSSIRIKPCLAFAE